MKNRDSLFVQLVELGDCFNRAHFVCQFLLRKGNAGNEYCSTPQIAVLEIRRVTTLGVWSIDRPTTKYSLWCPRHSWAWNDLEANAAREKYERHDKKTDILLTYLPPEGAKADKLRHTWTSKRQLTKKVWLLQKSIRLWRARKMSFFSLRHLKSWWISAKSCKNFNIIVESD